MHNGFLNFEGVKMSKSLGNVFDCDQIAAAVGGEALRYFCIKQHYRSPVDFEVQRIEGNVRFVSLEAADRELARFYEALAAIDAIGAKDGDGGEGAVLPEAEKLVSDARESLAEDFNAPGAVAALHGALTVANKLVKGSKGVDKQVRLRTLARLGRDMRTVGAAIGVFEQNPAAYLKARRDRLVAARKIDVALVEAKIAERKAARDAKEWARGDEIRNELTARGVALHDGDGGTDWSVQD